MEEILPLGYFRLPRAQRIHTLLKTHAMPYLGKDHRETQTADGRELNAD